jgi:hypothetical protein
MYRMHRKTKKSQKYKRYFQIVLNLIRAIHPARKNTSHERIWVLNMFPELGHQFHKGKGKGTLEVVPARFPGP